MSRWIAPGVVGVRGGRNHAPIPQWQKHLSVSGGGGVGVEDITIELDFECAREVVGLIVAFRGGV